MPNSPARVRMQANASRTGLQHTRLTNRRLWTAPLLLASMLGCGADPELPGESVETPPSHATGPELEAPPIWLKLNTAPTTVEDIERELNRQRNVPPRLAADLETAVKGRGLSTEFGEDFRASVGPRGTNESLINLLIELDIREKALPPAIRQERDILRKRCREAADTVGVGTLRHLQERDRLFGWYRDNLYVPAKNDFEKHREGAIRREYREKLTEWIRSLEAAISQESSDSRVAPPRL